MEHTGDGRATMYSLMWPTRTRDLVGGPIDILILHEHHHSKSRPADVGESYRDRVRLFGQQHLVWLERRAGFVSL
eukprot:c38559_g1_i1 orf=32-256(-)